MKGAEVHDTWVLARLHGDARQRGSLNSFGGGVCTASLSKYYYYGNNLPEDPEQLILCVVLQSDT